MESSSNNFSPIEEQDFYFLQRRLEHDNRLRCQVISGSMEPVIKTGEPIEVIPIREPLKTFDIIVFHQKDQLICHMVVKDQNLLFENRDSSVLTSAYRFQAYDLPVRMTRVLGRVTSHRVSLWRRIIFTWRFLKRN